MNEWIKWWNDKTFLLILGIIAITMLLSFLLAYFIEWGWIPAIVVACGGGLVIRRTVINKIDRLN